MRSKWDDFIAGIDALFLGVLIVTIITSVGDSVDAKTYSRDDIIWALFMLAVTCSAAVGLYKFFKRLP